ncbi:MAG: MBL fold metallo-hydrolase, partial [Candidatus Micrarchaeota archaeon]
MSSLTFLGGAGEVGRSGILFEDDKKILLDYGIKIHEKTDYPLPFQGFLNALIISHAHLDHSGFSPAAYESQSPLCFGTYPTQALSSLLIKDSMKVQKLRRERQQFSSSDFKRMLHAYVPLPYDTRHNLSRSNSRFTRMDHLSETNRSLSFSLRDAGHILGSSLVEVNYKNKKLVYTGDFKLGETRMHRGARLIKDVDVLIIESTYSDRDHPDRKELEKRLHYEVREVIERGGNVLFPAFAVGRSQELLQILHAMKEDFPVYLDGMAKTASEISLDYPSYMKDARAFRESLGEAKFVMFEAHRRRALSEPSVIVSTAGMLEGGPAMGYIPRLNKNSKIILTGYQIPDTNGWHLLNQKTVRADGLEFKVEIPVEYLDLSAHAGRSDLLKFISAAAPEKIFCVHGDHCDKFA